MNWLNRIKGYIPVSKLIFKHKRIMSNDDGNARTLTILLRL